VLQLQFLAHLFSLDDQQETLREAARFLDEHPLRWVEQFARRVAARCQTPFYAGLSLFISPPPIRAMYALKNIFYNQ